MVEPVSLQEVKAQRAAARMDELRKEFPRIPPDRIAVVETLIAETRDAAAKLEAQAEETRRSIMRYAQALILIEGSAAACSYLRQIASVLERER